MMPYAKECSHQYENVTSWPRILSEVIIDGREAPRRHKRVDQVGGTDHHANWGC